MVQSMSIEASITLEGLSSSPSTPASGMLRSLTMVLLATAAEVKTVPGPPKRGVELVSMGGGV